MGAVGIVIVVNVSHRQVCFVSHRVVGTCPRLLFLRRVRPAVQEIGVWVCPVIVSLSDSWAHNIIDCESFLDPRDPFEERCLGIMS